MKFFIYHMSIYHNFLEKLGSHIKTGEHNA